MSSTARVFDKFTKSFYRDCWQEYLTSCSVSLWGTELPATIGALRHLDVPAIKVYALNREAPGFAQTYAGIDKSHEKRGVPNPHHFQFPVIRDRKLDCMVYDARHVLFGVDQNAPPAFATITLDLDAGARVVRNFFYNHPVTEYRTEGPIYMLGRCAVRTAYEHFISELAAPARREMS